MQHLFTLLVSTLTQFSKILQETYGVASSSDKEDIDEVDNDEDDTKYASDLSENILTEGLNHRKIRNVEEKIAWLKKDDQIVEEIVQQFCPKPPATTASPPTEATTIKGLRNIYITIEISLTPSYTH